MDLGVGWTRANQLLLPQLIITFARLILTLMQQSTDRRSSSQTALHVSDIYISVILPVNPRPGIISIFGRTGTKVRVSALSFHHRDPSQ